MSYSDIGGAWNAVIPLFFMITFFPSIVSSHWKEKICSHSCYCGALMGLRAWLGQIWLVQYDIIIQFECLFNL